MINFLQTTTVFGNNTQFQGPGAVDRAVSSIRTENGSSLEVRHVQQASQSEANRKATDQGAQRDSSLRNASSNVSQRSEASLTAQQALARSQARRHRRDEERGPVTGYNRFAQAQTGDDSQERPSLDIMG